MGELTDAAAGLNRRQILEALVRTLAESIEVAPAASRAALAKQLADTSRELDGLAKPRGSKVDDLAERRARRYSGSAGSAQTAVDD